MNQVQQASLNFAKRFHFLPMFQGTDNVLLAAYHDLCKSKSMPCITITHSYPQGRAAIQAVLNIDTSTMIKDANGVVLFSDAIERQKSAILARCMPGMPVSRELAFISASMLARTLCSQKMLVSQSGVDRSTGLRIYNALLY